MFQSALNMMQKRLNTLVKSLVLSLLAPLAGCVTSRTAEKNARAERARAVAGTRATYCSAPRNADKRVDVDRLIAQLVELHANTYSFCIHGYATDWDDLKLILPRAREKGIRVWASLVPPSESPPRTRTVRRTVPARLRALGGGICQAQPAGDQSGGVEH